MLIAAERATLKQLIDQANMPCWKEGWTDSKGNTKRGFWYVFFEGKKYALGKYGAPPERGGAPDGQPGRKEFKEAVTARNAFLAEWVRKGAKKHNQKPQQEMLSVVRVVDCMNYYVEHHLTKVKNTAERKRYCVIFATGKDGGAHGILPYKGFGKLPLERLEGQHVDQWIAAHPNWSYPGRRKAVNVIKAALNYYVHKHSRSGITNPIRDYRVEKGGDQPTDRPMCLIRKEEVILRRCASRAYRIFFTACRDTGARPGELAIATPSHLIETNNGSIAISLSPQEWKNGLRHKLPRRRTIPLPKKWQRYVRRRRKLCAIDGPLFPTTTGGFWNQATWSKAFNAARTTANARQEVVRAGLRPYCTRHTFITEKLIAGMKSGIVDIERRLAKACGTSVEEIRQTYDHVFHEFQEIEEVMNI